MALTDSGHLYSFGANGCGQLGQYQNEYDRKRRESYEEITFPKITNDHGVSFMSGFESSNSISSSPRESSRNGADSQRGNSDHKQPGVLHGGAPSELNTLNQQQHQDDN